MCGAAPCALSASMLSHFSIARNVSGPHFFWIAGAFSASIAAPYSIQPFSARTAATAQAAVERPVHRAVAVIGAAVAVLAEGAAELAHHQHHRVAPCVAHRSPERGEAAAKLVEPRREIALRAAFADVRVPAA